MSVLESRRQGGAVSPVFPRVYCTMQADLLSASELKAELVSRALPVLPMYFSFLKLIF